MDAIIDREPGLYALIERDELCAECREQDTVRLILRPTVIVDEGTPSAEHLGPRRESLGLEDDLSNATWEDAEWQ